MTMVSHAWLPEGRRKDGAKGRRRNPSIHRPATMAHLHSSINIASATNPFPKFLHHIPSSNAMVFLKWKCPPERRKAIIAVSAKPSAPTISVNDTTNEAEEGKEPFRLDISLRIVETTQPGQAITICTHGSVFARSHPDSEYDTLSQRRASLASTSDNTRHINLGMFMIHHARPDPDQSPDLKERPNVQFLTIPADGEVVVTHDLSLARMFKHEKTLKPADVVGETWRPCLFGGAIGTGWWNWGGLDAELADRRLSAWCEWFSWHAGPKPAGDGWVFSRHPMELVFEDRTDSSFQFVE
jgi:hypothetical protein